MPDREESIEAFLEQSEKVKNDVRKSLSPTAEDAVRKSFNPSGNPDVTYIKGLTSQLIAFMESVRDRNNGLAGREAAVAITNIQTASMWSVLAATKGA